MIVYHGTDTLKSGQIPTPNMPDNGSFFSLTKEYATQFGSQVFAYEIDESLVLDLRKQSHKKMVKDKFSKDWSVLELNEANGLPWSFNDAKEVDSIDKIKEIALSL